jgi:hypothetical protein
MPAIARLEGSGTVGFGGERDVAVVTVNWAVSPVPSVIASNWDSEKGPAPRTNETVELIPAPGKSYAVVGTAIEVDAWGTPVRAGIGVVVAYNTLPASADEEAVVVSGPTLAAWLVPETE